ncbi:MAG: DEAD/DEAH box helicase [Bryobacteraceae bacterium]
MTTFSELPLSASLQERLSAGNFKIPTPVQAGAIPPALLGKDVLATANTGTGKTLGFLIPIIERLESQPAQGIEALVLVPTRELAMQVLEAYTLLRGRAKGASDAALVVGGLAEQKQLQTIRRGARLVVATPGRLEDFMRRKLVKLTNVKVLVLDEADRMLDMGFLPAIQRIASALPVERQTMCFSATLEASVSKLVKDYMRSPVRVEVGSTLKPSDRVKLQMFEVPSEKKLGLLQKLLDGETGSFLVFAKTRFGTERLAGKLSRAGFEAAMIHGDRSQSQRTAALHGFQQGKYRVLVATDVAARGIHVQNIAHVINYDLPQVPEDFIHRVGRTGRASERGVASTFATRQESGDIRRIERTLKITMERLPLDPAILAEVRTEIKDMQPVARERPFARERDRAVHSREGASRPHAGGSTKSFAPRRRRS